MSGEAAVGEVQNIATRAKSLPEKYHPEGSSEYSSKPGLGTRFSVGDFWLKKVAGQNQKVRKKAGRRTGCMLRK